MSVSADSARGYVVRFGWAVLPLPHGEKGPRRTGWQRLRIPVDAVDRYFPHDGLGIGVIMGAASGGLTDIDLDCPEARAAAPYLLRPTRRFGRKSSRYSHWLYVTDLSRICTSAVINFDDPLTPADGGKAHLLELRIGGGGQGAQTVFPPSWHKDSGETVTWEDPEFVKLPSDQYGPPRPTLITIDGAELLRKVNRLAGATLLARYFPKDQLKAGAKALGALLTMAGLAPIERKLVVEAVAVAAVGDGGALRQKGGIKAGMTRTDLVKAIIEHAMEERTPPTLEKISELFGAVVVDQALNWLGRGDAERPGDGQGGNDEAPEDLEPEDAAPEDHSWPNSPTEEPGHEAPAPKLEPLWSDDLEPKGVTPESHDLGPNSGQKRAKKEDSPLFSEKRPSAPPETRHVTSPAGGIRLCSRT
jgi:hypothetical protein